ncbi:tripartite tricarboxylate transporter substrate binding protein [Comamonas sp. CMM02]|uniref:tripartite tricarboxylate transporter substrate binding protein n=1 Tax=Comamonas sp. CMM02 TaxID=2769307 RepID=UPI00177DF666|nr:tripartite tricarboxylate transporter substrate binding protein [Comamonas sp. CMM02]MBD9401453.1 tripartite tricarboxylate transporter substrate binding protein [Comamonas sp. CMM02]
MQRRILALSALATAMGMAIGSAHAQGDSFPNKPITLIVPYGPGGVTDVIARALGLGMGKTLGQTVVVENKAGAAGAMGVVDMLTAKADGYRLTLAPVGIFRQPYIQKVSYDPVRDLTYIASFMTYDFILTVPANSPIQTLQDYVAWAKKHPGEMDYGTPGKFTANHVAMALLEKKTGITLNHAPFKGDADAINALSGNHIKSAIFANSILPMVQSGKVRALATAADKRPAAFADVPTFLEAGYGFDVPSPLGIAGPKGMPQEVVQKLDAAIKAAMDDPAFRQVIANYGIRTDYRDHKAYAAFAKQAFAQEKDIVQGIGLE